MTDPTATDQRAADLAARLTAVRSEVAAAVAAAGRAPGEVELLVVTKFFPAADVRRLIDLGERAFGESREPEASRKIAELGDLVAGAPAGAGPGVAFDMIGGVQGKKAKTIARWARSVHSVDRTRIVEQLAAGARAAVDDGRRTGDLGVFVQVSLDGDPARGGVVAADLGRLADEVLAAGSLRLRGLMAIAPVGGDRERWLADLAAIRERFLAAHPTARELSAGMSGDLRLAIGYGSTCVRVGTAIMGARPILSH
ncbi:MAG: YggS family pyridoxal phosphate-dependent enzyme [Gordonia sp. (in: high G+C Gram-positive bacteria)]